MAKDGENSEFYHEYKAPGSAWVNEEDLPQDHKTISLSLLRKNDGIGVIAGYYDENLSIQYISDLALYMMEYPSIKAFEIESKRSLLNLIKTQLNRAELEQFLQYELTKLNYVVLRGYRGIGVVVRVATTTVESKSGKKMWYASIKKGQEDVMDRLTGVVNRAGFLLKAEEMRQQGLNFQDYALLYYNIDNFKAVNELYTTKGGDDLLCHVCQFLSDSELNPILVSRLESDQFVILAKKDQVKIYNFYKIQKIPWDYEGNKMTIRARCGIYYIDNPRLPIVGMIDRAKLAKKEIDHESIKPYAVYDQVMSNQYMLKAEVEQSYLSAIENKEFKVYYQPVVDTMTGKIKSAEALVRWIHPQKGLISPRIFVPTLEEDGAIHKIDEYVNQMVYEFLRRRYKEGKIIVPVSVNLSWMDFYDKQFIDRILLRATNPNIPKGFLRYELTETSCSALSNIGSNVLERLRESGIKSLLDDFGSGYSSFNMLQSFDFDILKLDMSFTRQIETSEKVKSIIRGMVAMCHSMDIKMIAEGAETEKQVKFLQDIGCDYIQGYYFSKPLSESEFEQYLERELA